MSILNQNALPPFGFFSFYKRPIRNNLPLRSITLLDLCKYITSDYNKSVATRLALVQSKDERRKIKSELLDYITPAGVFEHRANNAVISVSGLVVLDFDDIPDPIPFITSLPSLPPILSPFSSGTFPFVLAWISPSTHGVKVLLDIRRAYLEESIPVGKNLTLKEKEKAISLVSRLFAAFEKLEIWNKKVDRSGKDLSRACYIVPSLLVLPFSTLFSQWKN